MFDLDRWEEIWQTINRNRKRSIMTAFGVFWGIFMLTVMMGSGLGLRNLLYANLNGMNENSCFLWGGKTSIPYKGLPAGRYWQLDNDDMRIIETQIPGIKAVGGIFWGSSYNFSRNDRKGTYSIVGYTPSFQQILPQRLLFGRFFNEIDMEQQRKVCILTEQVWLDLFPGGEDPVGSTIRMNNMYLTVIGMIKVPDRGFRFHGDKSVLMPVSTMQQMYNMGHKLHSVAVAANDDADIKEVETNIKQLVFARHTISPDDTKAVYSQNLGEQVNKFNSLFGGIGTLTWIVGIGTLLAGLVGVSNIMLVIVRERTQEIGVRRALGARPRIIISQIMSESFVLTFVAGIFGLALAVALLSGAESVLTASAGRPIRPQISFSTGMLSMTVLILGSLLAGILPASRALRIKPVDAIREE